MNTLAKEFKAAWLCAFLFLVLPAMSFAGGPTCPLATGLMPDGRILDLDYVQTGGTVWYNFNTIAGHSYSVEVRDDLDQNPQNDLTVTFYSSSCATQMNPASGPPYTPSVYHDTGATGTSNTEPKLVYGTRVSIPNPATDTISIKVVNSGSSGHYVSVTVSETTIYTPSWSTYSGFYTEFIIQNTTSQSINYTLTLTATLSGGQVYPATGTVNGAPATTSTGNLFTSSPPLSVPPQNGGYAILTHDGPPAALQLFESESNGTLFISVPGIAPVRGK